MKKNILYLLLGILALTSSCQDPEYVLPYCSMSKSNCCFLTCIQVSEEAGKAVWYPHLFPEFLVIHTKALV